MKHFLLAAPVTILLYHNNHKNYNTRSGQAVDLHDERDRRVQPPTAESNQIQNRVSNRRQPIKDAVSGNDGHHEKWTGHRQDWGSSTPSWRFTLKNAFLAGTCKRIFKRLH